MKKLWFKAKEYGWGWYPCSWEGWLVLAVYLAVVIGLVVIVFGALATANGVVPPYFFKSVALFLAVDMLATITLIVICYKTGEKPGWRWGEKKADPAKDIDQK